MNIVILYASVLAILYVYLSFRTIFARRKHKVSLGDRGNPELIRAIGVHANFAEYTPLALLLLFFVEQKEAEMLVVHALCICLLLGRFSHAYGVSQSKENFLFRVTGMILTFTSILGSSIYLLIENFL
ncbi:MAG: MAPEG family protein [Oligoflexia bacterium]|nr:MAPEG family protein [Oligoflexia bacterium]